MNIFYKKKTTYSVDKSLFLLFCCVAFGCAKSDGLHLNITKQQFMSWDTRWKSYV